MYVVITFCLGCHSPDNNLQNIVWPQHHLGQGRGEETVILIDWSYDMDVTTAGDQCQGQCHITGVCMY